MILPISARRVTAAESRVMHALSDDFDPRSDLRPFLEFARSRQHYADVANELLKIVFPEQLAGKFSIVKELLDPWLADEFRLARISRIFRLVPFEYFKFCRFEMADLKTATRAKRKSKRAWTALAILGYTRGPHGRPIKFDPEKLSPWPRQPKERAAILLRLIALRALELSSERRP